MLELCNHSPWAAGLFPGWDRDGKGRYTLVIKRTHRFFSSREEPEPLHPPAPLITADTYQGEPGDSPLLRATEAVPFKQGTDVLITGLDGLLGGRGARALRLLLSREGRVLLDKTLHRQRPESRRRDWLRPWTGHASHAPGPGPVPGHAAPQTRTLLGLTPLPTRLMTLPFQGPLPADTFNQAPLDQRLAQPLTGHETLTLQPIPDGTESEHFRLRLTAETIGAWWVRGRSMKPLTPVCDTLWLDGDAGLVHHIHRAGIPADAVDGGRGWILVGHRDHPLHRTPAA
ncbi:DUF2169 domain-containing protein [Ectothiorhodospira lacustris]|uniref:DUF2169 domain-containing protein n=1 Tax=Ectothiorhodospira lacustris TaxID=2899127 RepID=UPI001EE79532|nr:DUF2169 domain-containing protein [Ectothiorhodospira lacustris]MCG5509215.1 DUF2169 domain-containing protein [Ectothiorhodospira lacustris]MCG5521005.1 DUF2169 domain-containing protein [Ectothiorhodospira lacustris]